MPKVFFLSPVFLLVAFGISTVQYVADIPSVCAYYFIAESLNHRIYRSVLFTEVGEKIERTKKKGSK